MCVFVLSSCTKCDIPAHNPGQTPDPEPITATVTYTMTDRLDLSKYATVTVKYTDSTGAAVSEVVTTATWEKTITGAKVPGTYNISVTYARNSTPLDKEEYKCGAGVRIKYSTPNSMSTTGNSEIYNSTKDEFVDLLEFLNRTDNNTVEIIK